MKFIKCFTEFSLGKLFFALVSIYEIHNDCFLRFFFNPVKAKPNLF